MLAYFEVGVLVWLEKNNKDDFDGYFLQSHPLEYLIEETLGEKFLVHHDYM